MRYVFGDYTFDTRQYELCHAGESVKLRLKVFQVLAYLITHRDRPVPKQELCEHLWPQQFVSDATLDSCIAEVRHAVGDSGRSQHIIQTRRGYGYRFVAVVEVYSQLPSEDDGPPAPPTPHAVAEEVPERTSTSTDPALAPEMLSGLPVQWVVPVSGTVATPCAVCQHMNSLEVLVCVVCGTRLAQACPRCERVVRLPATYCPACGHELVWPLRGDVHPDVAAPVVAPLPPRHLSPRALTGEHKVVTVLVCTLARATLGEPRREAEAWHQVLQTFVALIREEVEPYEGTLQGVLEDGVVVLFGAPVAQEDHAQRAVLAALGLLQRLRAVSLNSALLPEEAGAVRMGLHTGPVVIGSLDDDLHITYTPVGDTTRLPTRLARQAPPGTILVSEATARLVHGSVRLAVDPPVPIPGYSTTYMTYQVLGLGPRHAHLLTHGARPLSPLVGRALELATLETLLRRAEDGQGQVVSLVGEPGMGKTRLVYEFCQRLAPSRVVSLVGRCVAYGQATPYMPVCELLRQACSLAVGGHAATTAASVYQRLQACGMDSAETAPFLLHLLGIPEATTLLAGLNPQTIRRRTFAALHELFLLQSQLQPLLMVVENLHWSDPTSQEYFVELVERLMGVPLLLLVTFRPGYRPAWMEKSYATQITLARLGPEDSRPVVQAVLHPAPCPEPLLQGMVTKAAGNPLFLEELAWAVREQGSLPSEVPAMVQAVLAARIDRLPAVAKRLLQTAAVIGPEVPLALLQATTDLPEATLEGGLIQLQAAEFLYEAYPSPVRTYAFKHVLTQEVAYQSLLDSVRRQLHHRIAHVLEASFPEIRAVQPELLAHHYVEAGRAERAVPYWQQAGERARQRAAHAEAISHLAKGLEVLATLLDTPTRLQHELAIQTTLGLVVLEAKGQGAPEVERAFARAHALCQQAGETPQLFRILLGLRRYYFDRAEFQTTHELNAQLLTLAQHTRDPELLLEAHRVQGSTLASLGQFIAARTHLEQCLALYDPQQYRSHTLLYGIDPGAMCLSWMSFVLWMLGYPDQALQSSQAALTLAQALAHAYSLAMTYVFAASFHQLCREEQATQEWAEAAIALSTTQGFPLWLAGGTGWRGWALAMQGQEEEGITQIRQALVAWQATGRELNHPWHLALLAEAYGKAGQVTEGLNVLAEAFAVTDKAGERFYEAELYRLKGELLQNGACGMLKAAEAETCFRQALDIARGQQAKSLELRAAMSLSRLWQRQGKRDHARALLTEIYGWFTEGFETLDLQEARALLQELGGHG